MSTNIRLSKAQLSKIIQPGVFLRVLVGKLVGPLMKVAVILTKNVANMTSATEIDGAIQGKMYGKGVVRAGK